MANRGSKRMSSRLGDLDGDPDAQFEHSLELLQGPGDLLAVLAGLRKLRDLARPAARLPLLELYGYYAEDPTKRDRGATVRREILSALRPIARAADLPVFEAAATANEWLPPGPSEVGAPLRAAALLAIEQVDPERAEAYAVHLLYDPHVERMSGEPAITAARVLGAHGMGTVLYAYVIGTSDPLPEVAAEALRHLTDLPAELLRTLAEAVLERGDPAQVVGLAELLMEHPAGTRLIPEVAAYLGHTRDLDLYRYIVTLAIASRRREFVSMVLDRSRLETREDRIQVLLEALAVRAGDPEVEAASELLHKRLNPGS